ncbi:hypothetical protein NG99_23230 [Erwinia typographi]|uniref:Uncharacterized protein n=1 Tax=Erwinia typographi TaxID=371042 RepID=A0A0A3YL03_9GAMM|nr:hypothetical protein [Erwinia typographi]KGT87462.1 hypothetical protein NG99_23230 [Erwinia typographi]
MTTYNTRNPLGSSAAKDLYDNAQNLDHFVNDLDSTEWADRFGVMRRTWHGMETEFEDQMADQESRFVNQLDSQEDRFYTVISQSGYDVIGDYESGILTITEYNQLVRYNNELWKLTAATSLPYTTQGTTSETWDSLDGQHFVNVADAALRQELTDSDGYKLVGQCNDYAALREIVPEKAGQRMLLREYTFGTGYGGGEFVSVSGSGSDDGGANCVVNDSWYWKRTDDPDQLDVTHFGAVPGTSDSHDAVLRMYNWAQSNYPSVGVQFPPGAFLVSPIDDSATSRSYVRFVGAGRQARFGYFSTTTITSDKSTSPVLKVKSRRVEVGGIIFNGQNTTTAQSNTQGFFQNIMTQGQYTHIYNMVMNYSGGVGFAVVDTIDTLFADIYSNYCWDSVIKATYSSENSWDHSTAIKLTEHNHQYYQGTNALLDLQRCTQSLMNNVWIEHAYNGAPMNINNGQWQWDAVSIEDCHVAINAQDSRLTRNSDNFQGQSSIDTTDSGSPWLSVWEAGQIQIQPHGMRIQGQMSVDLLTSRQLINNEGGSSTWYKLGRAYIGLTNQEVSVEVLGVRGFTSLETSLLTIDGGRDAHGKATLRIQRISSGSFKTTMDFEGSSCALTFQCVVSASYVTVYVQIAEYTRNASVFVKTNGPDRFSSGTSAKWWPDVASQTAAPGGTTPQARVSVHNRLAGVGANEDGNVVVKTNATAVTALDGYSVAGMMSIVVNGTRRWIPYYNSNS